VADQIEPEVRVAEVLTTEAAIDVIRSLPATRQRP
jgi:hypothetical protein